MAQVFSRRGLGTAACAIVSAAHIARVQAASRHTSLHGRHMVGYQGWFVCPGDPDSDGWVHWFLRERDGRLLPTFDMLPDTSEMASGEGCPTPWSDRAGRPIRLFSAQDAATIRRHFAWMAAYDLHCAALQRFVAGLVHPRRLRQIDRVLSNVRAAAEAEHRAFFIMYDLSGVDDAGLSAMVEDWRRQVADGLLDSPALQWHRGRPVLGIWGLGFRDRPLTPPRVFAALTELRRIAEPRGLTLIGGVPAGWRTGDMDAAPGWADIHAAVEVLSPWTVGRYADAAGADTYRRTRLMPDLAATRARGQDLLPVIFPGFSWANLMRARQQDAPLNQIARRCGAFYWHQAANAVNAGASMLYTAMFDEVNEGTAIFKLAPSPDDLPASANFVALDADGCALPADWYLRLARGVSRGLQAGDLPGEPVPLPP